MRRSPASLIAGSFALATVALGSGCVPQDKYDALVTTNNSLKEEIVRLNSENDQSRQTAQMMQERFANANAQLGDLQTDNERLKAQMDQLGISYAELEAMLNEMEPFPLPDNINRALQELAAAYPGLLTYDAKKGMVQFASDLTFDLGSAELRPNAAQSIERLAQIVNDASIASYEVKVVGHTDAVPIVNAATKAKHPTNTHLSVHRAISVAQALITNSTDPRRIQVAGYGPYRPVVAEGPGGAAENRRVEIYLVPMTGGDLAATDSAGATGTGVVAQPEDPMK
jgi:chemotaxis protein MotB